MRCQQQGPAGTCEPAGAVAETPDLDGAYPRLSGAQLAALDRLGRRRRTRPREILFAEGDRDYDFFAVLAGHVAVVDGHGTAEARWRSGSPSSGPGQLKREAARCR